MTGGIDELILTDATLPPMFRSADRASLTGQAETVRWSGVQLGLLVAGAFLGAVDVELHNGIDLGALCAAVALLVSLGPAMLLSINNPQRSWYRGRAAAETLRTLSWKYAVRAEPFAASDAAADERLLRDMADILHGMQDVGWSAGAGEEPEITPAMRRLRAEPLAVRQQVYLQGRLRQQHSWYATKAATCKRMARRWAVLGILATVLGLVGGCLKAFGVLHYDGLGSASAVAATATAVIQLKQYRPLAAAYSLTARELLLVISGLERPLDDEAAWARRCSEAEEALSREHTMWLARREAA
ncbi:DUF4231 domain-containing protein [Streptomyces sp. NPDC052036]|uniref:DUF4231 domain-containing protein n=1 Tax=unclassified Streptomyces TaxID=2593676 RepID=UPI003426A82F